MKRLKFLPSVLMLVACVAVLCIGIYAVSPVNNEINGTLTITSMSKVNITGYVNDQMFFSTQKTANGVSMNLNESGALNFDASEAATASDIPQKIIRIRIQNLTNKELGAYFYSGEGLDANNLATYSSLVHEYKIYPQGADNTNPENSVADVFCSTYTYIAPASADNTYDEVDLYANIDITKVDYEQFVCDFAMKLRIEEYKPNVTGSSYTANTYDLVKLSSSIANGETTTPRTTVPAVANDTKMGTIVIPTSVTTVASNTFVSCSALEHIIFPNSITSMYSKLFDMCPKITSLSMPQTIPTDNGLWFTTGEFNYSEFISFFGTNEFSESVSYACHIGTSYLDAKQVNIYLPNTLNMMYFTKTLSHSNLYNSEYIAWGIGNAKYLILGQQAHGSLTSFNIDYLLVPAHLSESFLSEAFSYYIKILEFAIGGTKANFCVVGDIKKLIVPESYTFIYSHGEGYTIDYALIKGILDEITYDSFIYGSVTTLDVAGVKNLSFNPANNLIIRSGTISGTFWLRGNVFIGADVTLADDFSFYGYAAGSGAQFKVVVEAGPATINAVLPDGSDEISPATYTWTKTVGNVSTTYSIGDSVMMTRDANYDTIYTAVISEY